MLHHLLKPMLFVLCVSLSMLANPLPQEARVEATLSGSPRGVFSSAEEKELLRKLKTTPEAPVPFTNPALAGVLIVDAGVKTVSRDATPDPMTTYATDSMVQLRLTLQNNTVETVTGVILKITSQASPVGFFVTPKNLKLAPGKSQQLYLTLMAATGDSASLKVEGIASGYGNVSPWTQNLSANTTRQPLRRPDNPPVDSKPRPLNRLRPQYTEPARANGVMGAVRLFALVGTDGVVKKVEIVNALADGLTEEAINVAKVLQFQPALLHKTKWKQSSPTLNPKLPHTA